MLRRIFESTSLGECGAEWTRLSLDGGGLPEGFLPNI